MGLFGQIACAYSALTGLPNNTVVIITTCGQGNRTHRPANATLWAYMCVGIAKSWRDPVILHNAPLVSTHRNPPLLVLSQVFFRQIALGSSGRCRNRTTMRTPLF